ncbi:hypothetical protein ACQKL5_10835 [Peribacillus sp. NPDC097675]|uniref:hypothetical protein n=1 Tax=Peribacillus sp. NPDC097675 TaxID=3390618 RepID=UPI003CFCC998
MIQQTTLLTRNQAARVSGISGKCFNYLIQKEAFNPYLIKDETNNLWVNPEVIPSIKEYYSTHNGAYHYYNSHADYIPAYHVAGMLNLSYRQLIEDMRAGKWDGIYVEVPKCAPPPADLLDINHNYFFIRSKFFDNRYNTLEQIAKKTTMVSLTSLHQYRRKGLLPQPADLEGTNLYDEREVIQLLPSIAMAQKEQGIEQIGSGIQNAFDLLNSKQQQIITNYLDYRAKGGKIDYNGYRSKHQIANKEVTLAHIKRILSSVFVLIISGRCEIEEDFHKNPFYRNLAPDAFSPDVFDIYSVNKDDYFYLASKRKGKTLINFYQQLRPFYYYLLEILDDEAEDDEEEFQKYRRIRKNVMKFLKHFPTRNSDLNKSEINSKTKTFLTREQMVMTKQLILEDVRATDPFRNATMWQLSCSTGVRPEELHKLRIDHFLLNADGYIETDEDGWGILRLPAHISKQENSPSHSNYHTPIPADTVRQLNRYLGVVYKKQGNTNSIGKGFLFRLNYALPEFQYKKPITFSFINRLRSRIDFLDDLRKQDFIFKSSRHSLNNTIMRSFIQGDPALNDLVKKTAADHQLRHKPTKSVGEEFYLDEITKEQYYQVLDATINFPWDLEKLHMWEEEKGYRISKFSNELEQKNSEETDEESKKLQLQLIDLEEQLQRIQIKPKHSTEQQWLSDRQALIKTKNLINHALKRNRDSNDK